jgi:hypothetical protein
MNSCVVSGIIGEAEDWQISGYMHGPNKEQGATCVPVMELIESTTRCLHIAKCHSSGSEKLYHSICGQNYCNTVIK